MTTESAAPARTRATPAGLPRVVFITGWCRSGSTVIGNLLNEHPAAVHAGELSYLWANGVTRTGTNTTCGCGADLARCSLWREVLGRLGAVPGTEAGAVVAREMIDGHARFLRTRHLRARLAESHRRDAQPAALASVTVRRVSCYQAIRAVTGATTIVDSSKFPAEAAALCGLEDLDIRILHLVRDPRATAYSWQRAKSYIPPLPAARSTVYWTAFNGGAELIGRAWPGRYFRVRYEDFAARPRAVLAGIMRWAGLDGQVPVDTDGTALLGVNHTVTGNPDRLHRGPVRVRPDEQWRHALSMPAGMTATALASPLLARYGYRFTGWRGRPRRHGPAGTGPPRGGSRGRPAEGGRP